MKKRSLTNLRLFVVAAIFGFSFNQAAHAEEQTLRDRALMAASCGPILDLTLERIQEPGLYDVSKTNPPAHVEVVRLLDFARSGLGNFAMFTSFDVAADTGQSSSEVSEQFTQGEAQTREQLNSIPAGKLPAQVIGLANACAATIWKNDKRMEDAFRQRSIEFLEQFIKLYIS